MPKSAEIVNHKIFLFMIPGGYETRTEEQTDKRISQQDRYHMYHDYVNKCYN